MKYKFDIKDAFVIPLTVLLYTQLTLFLLSFFSQGQEGDLIVRLSLKYLSEKYYLVKAVGVVGAFSTVILWFWMLFDWGNRTFVKKKYKVYWFIVFFLTYAFGSTVYYFTVRKFKKGLTS